MDLKLIDGVPHWSARGADSFVPFKSSDTYYMKHCGEYTTTGGWSQNVGTVTINISDYLDKSIYSTLTSDSFIFSCDSGYYNHPNTTNYKPASGFEPPSVMSYDASDGTLVVYGARVGLHTLTQGCGHPSFDVYAIY